MFTPGMRKAHEEYVERERKRYRRQRREYTKGERSQLRGEVASPSLTKLIESNER